MLGVKYSTQFKRDVKVCEKRHYDLSKLQEVLAILRIPEKLPARNRNHHLGGEFGGYQECHIAPDWLLVYQYREDMLFLARTGTHADLFGK